MTATQASLEALAAHTRKRADAATDRIHNALKQMRRQNAEITISSVSRRSGVSRTAIHRRKELLALIRAHRPLEAVDVDTSPPPAANTETSIVAALRSRLIAKDKQIAELKATLRQRDHTIAALHGELDNLIATSPPEQRQPSSAATPSTWPT